MNKICTSIEQSKKLLELGIDRNTADMYWWSSGKRYYIEAMDDGDFNEEEGHIPAWSLTALLDLIPDIIGDYVLRLDKVDGDYYIWYDEIGKGWSDDMPHPSSDNFIDVAYENLVLLLENKKI